MTTSGRLYDDFIHLLFLNDNTNTCCKTQEVNKTPQRALLTYGDPNVDEYCDPWFTNSETDDDVDTGDQDVEDILDEMKQVSCDVFNTQMKKTIQTLIFFPFTRTRGVTSRDV